MAEPSLCATEAMDVARRLRLPGDRPLWRAIIVNPDGAGWSGMIMHFDHAIADGTRIARHILRHIRPREHDVSSTDSLPQTSLQTLRAKADPRVNAAPVGLCRIPFDGLRDAVPDAASHGDALLRYGRRILDDVEVFNSAPTRRKDRASVARIEALRSVDGQLGNHAQMKAVDLSKASDNRENVLFQPLRTPLMERARMGAARFVPAPLLRRLVQAEFSRPAIVLTIVPVARRLPPLFGMPLQAIHPAAPALGRPMLALTATRTGDGFDLCVTAHGPGGATVPGLSQRVAAIMARGTR